MERREIEIFLTLAEELHFGRTAERLYVSGALVSRTVKKIERRVGAALFERTSRRVALTPVGQRLCDQLRPAYERVQAAVDQVVATGHGEVETARADPRLEPADHGPVEAGGSGPAPPPPRELPNDITAFVGREAELAVIFERITAGSGGAAPVMAIDGAAGAGKSALAIHVAYRASRRFPDGQLYANLRGASPSRRPVSPEDVLARFLRSLGLAPQQVPTDLDEAAARFRSQTVGRRLLVVLDDAATAAQVRPLLPADSGCAVLVTSRRPLATLDGAMRLRLGRLPPAESVAMLYRLAAHRRADVECNLAAKLVRLAELCDHLPLALRIAAARLASRTELPVAALVSRLEDARRRLDELSVEDIAVRASLSIEYEQLDTNRAQALSALSAVDVVDVDLAAAAAVLGQHTESAEPILERLVEANLLESTRPGRYGLHDLPRLLVREQATMPEDQPAAVARLFGHYLATLRRAMQLLHQGWVLREVAEVAEAQPRPLADQAEAAGWLASEERNLAVTTIQAADCPGVPAEAIAAMIGPLGEFADRHGHGREWFDAAHAALRRAQRDGDQQSGAGLHGNLGMAAVRRQCPDEAQRHLERAHLLLDAGDRLTQARILAALAWVHDSRGAHDQAELRFHQAADIHQELGNQRGQALVWSNLGRLYTATGRAELALAYLRPARRLLVAQGELHAAYTANNLGDAYRALGRHRVARACYECGLAPEPGTRHRLRRGLCIGGSGPPPPRHRPARPGGRPTGAGARRLCPPGGPAGRGGRAARPRPGASRHRPAATRPIATSQAVSQPAARPGCSSNLVAVALVPDQG